MPKPSITSLEFQVDAKEREPGLAPALVREKFRLNALTNWAHYSTTGLYANAEEVDAWLAKLEAGEDADPPKCHV